MVRLVEQHCRSRHALLLAAPVGEFGGDDRIDVGADLGVAQELDGGYGVEDLLQVGWCHGHAPSWDVSTLDGRFAGAPSAGVWKVRPISPISAATVLPSGTAGASP